MKNETNSLGLTKKEMDELYSEEITEASKKLINKHICYTFKGSYCCHCGKRICTVDSEDL